ncbi:MAG: NAD(+)/NADH kinase [Clostridiales bacterium]|nr:NAD(+)/NADH kinase [Clostridiales bacterium]
MKIAITVNSKVGTKGETAVKKFKNLLEERKIEYFDFEKGKKADILVVFGGDGTVLANAEYATATQTPILAINVGTVGYLAEFEEKDVENAVNLLLSGNFSFTEKSVLKVITSSGEEYVALNDAVLERGRFTDDITVVAKLSLKIDGYTVYDVSGDGIIIATPTGSTAYSLSSGGVILTPDLNSFIATPVCPHSLNAKPIVYRDDKRVDVSVLTNSCDCVLCIDGRCVKTLKRGESITVTKNDKTLKIIDSCENFYKKIIKKIR